jgi:membrane dipeptidase
MDYFDLHCDTITKCFDSGQKLAHNDLALSLERTHGYEKWAQFFAVWIDDTRRGESAFDYFRGSAEFLQEEIRENGDSASFCRTASDLKAAAQSGRRAALLSIEGSAALAGDMEHLYDAKRLGVSMITLTWNGHCEAGDGCGVPHAEGLTPFGISLVRRMQKLNIIADVSHLSEKGFWDVARAARRPFIASHSDSKAVFEHRRNLTDDQFREIVKGGGLVGINLCGEFLRDGSPRVDDVLRHVDHFLHLGGENILAVGSDLDGCVMAAGVRTADEMSNLYDLLKHSFGADIADRIFWQNAFRFFTENLD